jgi:pimeloyl-ACP methyl ester carboxylesterase
MFRPYRQAMRRADDRVAAVPSQRFSSSIGEIEYVAEGTGPAVLLAHGIYGGHDNATDMVEAVLGPGYRTIGPSRFGYFGSTIPADATVEGQVDAYVELLDHLGIDKVVAIGYSAGGPSAIGLALRHPARLHGLILAAAYLPKPGALPELVKPAMRWALGAQPLWWLLRITAPRLLGRIMGVPRSYRPASDEQAVVDDIMEHLFPISAKKAGAVFDTLVSEPASNNYPLEDLAVPVLLVHAPDDPLAGYRYAERAAHRIPGAQLATIPRGGHLFLGTVPDVHAATRPFAARVGASAVDDWP